MICYVPVFNINAFGRFGRFSFDRGCPAEWALKVFKSTKTVAGQSINV